MFGKIGQFVGNCIKGAVQFVQKKAVAFVAGGVGVMSTPAASAQEAGAYNPVAELTTYVTSSTTIFGLVAALSVAALGYKLIMSFARRGK